MIPKIIHYCWLSDDPIPNQYQEYIDEWHKIMPDYQIIKWDRKRIDLIKHPFAKAAFEAKKYAFAADYIRVYALYTEGGIYLDSDVKVLHSFDNFLSFSYFTSFEHHWKPGDFKMMQGRYFDKKGTKYSNIEKVIGVGVQAAIIGAEAHHPIMHDLYKYYSSLKWNEVLLPELAPYVHARIAEKYGFKYVDKLQFLEKNITIFPSDVFMPKEHITTNNTHAIHMSAGSWVDSKSKSSVIKLLKRSKILMSLYMKWKIIRKSQNG